MLKEGVDGEDEMAAHHVDEEAEEDVVGVEEADLDIEVVDMEGEALDNGGSSGDDDDGEEDVVTGFEAIVGTAVIRGHCFAVV